MNQQILPPAQIWIGNKTVLEEELVSYLQSKLCKQDGCQTCYICMAIRTKQCQYILWLAPEKRYTLDALEPLFKTISFSLEKNEQFFIILKDAEKLSPACSNALLKSIEEPPVGYYFIFCTDRKDALLPTIQSRSMIKEFASSQHETTFQQLFQAFIGNDPLLTLELIGKEALSEDEAMNFLEQLLEHFTRQLTEPTEKNEVEQIRRKIKLLHNALEYSPMPGSSKLFLKNLFLGLQV